MMMKVIDGHQTSNDMTVYPSSGTGYYYRPLPWNGWPPYGTITFPTPPTNCSGDVHVFTCPHCNKCKCGGATKR